MEKRTFQFDPGSYDAGLRERRLVFADTAEAADSLADRAAQMTAEEAENQLTHADYLEAEKGGWFKDSVPPSGSRADVEKPKLTVIDGEKPKENQAEGLSDAEKEKFSKAEQSELAKLEDRADGNIMQVGIDNLEIMQTVLRSRDDIARTLEHEALKRPDIANNPQAQANFVMNTLVTEELRTQIEDMERKLYKTKTGGREISEKKLRKRVDARIHGKSGRDSRRFENITTLFGRQGGLRSEGRTTGNFADGLDDRIQTINNFLQNPNAPNRTAIQRINIAPGWNRDLLAAELAELRKLRTSWKKTEKNLRGEVLTLKRTDKRFLNRTFGFINQEGDPEHAVNDFVGNANLDITMSPNERQLLVTYLNDAELQKYMMGDRAALDTWLLANAARFNPAARTNILGLYDNALVETYRNLNTVVSYDNTAKWRDDSYMRMLLNLLTSTEYRTLFNGGTLNGISLEGGVVNRSTEIGGKQEEINEINREIANIDQQLTTLSPHLSPIKVIKNLKERFSRDELETKDAGDIIKELREVLKDLRDSIAEADAGIRQHNNASEEIHQADSDISGQDAIIDKYSGFRGGLTPGAKSMRDAAIQEKADLQKRRSEQVTQRREGANKINNYNSKVSLVHHHVNQYHTALPGNWTAISTLTNLRIDSPAIHGTNLFQTYLANNLNHTRNNLGTFKSFVSSLESNFKGVETKNQSSGTIKGKNLLENLERLQKQRNEAVGKRSEAQQSINALRSKNQPTFSTPEEAVTSLMEMHYNYDWCVKHGESSISRVPVTERTKEKAKARVQTMKEKLDVGIGNITDTLDKALENRPATFRQWMRRQPNRTWSWLNKPIGEMWGGKKLIAGTKLAKTGAKKTFNGGKILAGLGNRVLRSVSPSAPSHGSH